MQRDGSLEGLNARTLGIELKGKGATPRNVEAYIQQLVGLSDDLTGAGIPAGLRQAELLKRIRASRLGVPMAGVVGAAALDPFDEALAATQQVLIDIDGDGQPDVMVPAR